MIHIIKNDENVIHYTCDCGVKGFCMVKPRNEDATIVVDIKCPTCGEAERIVLLQYSSDKTKEDMLSNLNATKLSWSSIISNEVVGSKEDGGGIL